MKRLLLMAMCAVFAVGMSYADQSKSKVVTIPVNRTAPNSGKQMFASYCAPCHGTDGRGNGPAAPALKSQPTDLTGLMKNNHGKYPDAHVAAILQFGATVPAHGSVSMPVWGPILGNMNQSNAQDKQLRISNLCAYLKSIQVK